MALDLSVLYRGPLSSCNYGCAYCPFAKHAESAAELAADRRALGRFVDWVGGRAGDRVGVLFTPWGEALVRRWYQEAHGSSASGAVAYREDGPRRQALTTAEMVRAGGELRLYNSRRLRRYEDPGDVAGLIDALAREGVRAEEWVPKAGLGGLVLDLRVVVIAGRARHAVVRTGRGPMTNLHLLNRRGDLAAVAARAGPEGWRDARRSCERAASAFPGSLHVGVDLLFTPGFRGHAVLEGNAFGDLLPGVLCGGVDTYGAEIRALAARGGGAC